MLRSSIVSNTTQQVGKKLCAASSFDVLILQVDQGPVRTISALPCCDSAAIGHRFRCALPESGWNF